MPMRHLTGLCGLRRGAAMSTKVLPKPAGFPSPREKYERPPPSVEKDLRQSCNNWRVTQSEPYEWRS
jgi:hypothetical protein